MHTRLPQTRSYRQFIVVVAIVFLQKSRKLRPSGGYMYRKKLFKMLISTTCLKTVEIGETHLFPHFLNNYPSLLSNVRTIISTIALVRTALVIDQSDQSFFFFRRVFLWFFLFLSLSLSVCCSSGSSKNSWRNRGEKKRDSRHWGRRTSTTIARSLRRRWSNDFR